MNWTRMATKRAKNRRACLYVVLLVIWVSELHGATIMHSLVARLDTRRFKGVKYMACEPFAPTIRTF
jgi:hypothetical protein